MTVATPTKPPTLADEMAGYWDRPLEFVLECFPWGEPGELGLHDGPDTWQRKILTDIGIAVRARGFDGLNAVLPILFAVASGHGIGKSTLFAWIHWWIMCTRHNAKGRVTANTYTQLETTTWAEVQKWWKLLICRDSFEVTGSKAYHKENKEGWFSVPITCSEENSEAFAGQHNAESTSFFLFDESSLIPDKIFEVAGAGLTDGEPMWFCAGNPTRNTGTFYEICFGDLAHRWDVRSIDSRDCKMPNHVLHTQWIEDHGLDSDYVRVRVRGLPPAQAEDQLISRDTVDGARSRDVEPFLDDPLVVGVDVPDGGSAWFAVQYRRGLSARPGPLVPAPVRLPGDRCDRTSMVAVLARILGCKDRGKRVAMMFIDSQPGAAIVERLHALGYDNVQEVSFAGKSPDRQFANMRAFMWGKQMREFLERGCIDPEDARLRKEISSPGFHHRVGGDGALTVESKADMSKRGIASPDFADALALTFAYPVAPLVDKEQAAQERYDMGTIRRGGNHQGWMR